MSTPNKPKTNWTLFGAIAAAIAGSICCLGPLLLLALGIGGAWVGNLKVLEPFRPWFMLIAMVFLAIGFYRVYRKPKPEECKGGSYCAKPHAGRMNKIGLWIALVLILGLFAYPYVAGRIASRAPASSPPLGSTEEVVLGVKGMSCAGCVATAQEFDHTHAAFDAFLKAHVTDGAVDYRAIKAAPAALNGYLNTLAAVREREFKTWSKDRQLAFYFNLYNAATLKLIVDHYPLESIKDIGTLFKGPWDQKVVRLFGETITLNNLEHDILRKEYKEPRLHMALVCAAKGCPPLRNEAYVAEKLNDQLNDQSKVYLTSPHGLQIDRAKGEARISSIFKWYGKDFTSVTDFVEKHSGKSLKGLKIRYLDYDWRLNDK